MKNEALARYRKFYRDQLLEDCIPFWMKSLKSSWKVITPQKHRKTIELNSMLEKDTFSVEETAPKTMVTVAISRMMTE